MGTASHQASNPSIGVPRTAGLVLLGAVLWFAAAMMLRYLGPMGVFEGVNRVILYALIVPGTFPFVLIAWKLFGLRRDQIAIAIAIVTATATLLDGLALAWLSGLYGPSPEQALSAAATILWGAGVGLVQGLALNKTAPSNAPGRDG